MGTKAVAGANGKTARFFVAEQELCVEDWDIDETATEHDTTSSCDAGKKTQETGNSQLVGSVNYTFDVTSNIYDAPPDLTVGTKHALSKLYKHSSPGVGLQDGPFYELTLQVLSHSASHPVDGKIGGVINFKSHGDYTLPTGSDSSGA